MDSLKVHLPRKQTLTFYRPIIMGILNVTPDSFSDGGAYGDVDAAVEHARVMLNEGADIIDIGGESTRPGAQKVDANEQISRVVPVIQQLQQQIPECVISIDTTLAPVAQAALSAGVVMLNDISAGRDDPAMFELAAKSEATIVITHMQGSPATMQDNPKYDDVVNNVEAFLMERADSAISAGVLRQQIRIDPGIGFGKTYEHNLTLLNDLARFVSTGFPVLLGTSRKRFLGQACRDTTGQALSPHELIGATCATTALGVMAGISIFRVHDVRPNRQAADTAWAIKTNTNTADENGDSD